MGEFSWFCGGSNAVATFITLPKLQMAQRIGGRRSHLDAPEPWKYSNGERFFFAV